MNTTQTTWYKPRDIARLGLIKNSTGGDNVASNYIFIVNLIKRGRLKARNYARNNSSRPYWLVSKNEIDRYNNEGM